ncbi:hypothetical protein L210DRAFT_987584 [Boletus edulis BED1]|uniref:Uncharacterized protein n=1 Tax=Boletus edulis BED1 TaxID=1328754 RepID=A0AAD4BIX2_BOLED|nr:hypothetical protein L210DRAFT_987584 [Boletus edulis BED1]
MSATTSLPCSNIKPFRTGITAPHRPLRDPSTTNPEPQKQYRMLGIGAGIGRITADVLHLISDVVRDLSTTNPEPQKWYRMLDIGAGIGRVTADILHLISDVVLLRGSIDQMPYYRISNIYNYMIAGRTSLPPAASPPCSPIAGPSSGITFPDVFHLVLEEAVRSDSYDLNDYNPSDYEVQIKREEEDLQEQDQLANYDSSLDQGYRTLVNHTTLAPDDAPSTIVRATTVDTADLPDNTPNIPYITETVLRLRLERVKRHQSSELYAKELSLVVSRPEILQGLRGQDKRYNRPQIVSRKGFGFEKELLPLFLISLTFLTGSAFLTVLLAIALVHSNPTQLLGCLYVSVLISRTVSEYTEINETPENIQIRPENPEPQPQPQRPRIRQAQLAALAEQEAAAEAGEPIPPPQRPLRIPTPLASRNPDFEPEQADHSALESKSDENFNYPT